MFIQIVDRYGIPGGLDTTRASFYLAQDHWDDYHYKTSYNLFLTGRHTKDGTASLIGLVKILKKGQKEKEWLQLNPGFIDELDDNFCSLGQSLDYYERIAQLEPELKERLIKALRDIALSPENLKGFEIEPGLAASLYRGFSADDDIFTMAPMLVTKDFNKLPSLELEFQFKTSGMSEPMVIDFDAPKFGPNDDTLPNRITVVIGRNGSGKSSLLAKLSRVVFASTSDRKSDSMKQVGEITPVGLGFPRIINLAYNSFDNFHIPGIYVQEKKQIAKDLHEGVGRYIFCGVRNISAELDSLLQVIKAGDNGRLSDADIREERQKATILKPINILAAEFSTAIEIIQMSNRRELLLESLDILRAEPSMNAILQQGITKLEPPQRIDFFMLLSTGHKFVLHSIANIIRYIEPRSLLLFDEPETHLHPPLLAVLMKAIRYILHQKNGFMMVATHSPVVVQETLSKHVFIIRREGDIVKINKPSIQTFGENIGIITSHVFGLSTDITDYHEVLENLVAAHTFRDKNFDKEKVLARIEKLFDGNLSMQARAYVLTKLSDPQN
jgi:predicted ATPase